LKAVIFAAGTGKRLRPLTSHRPKHLLTVAGKAVIVHVLEALAEAGIKQVGVTVGYFSELIQESVAAHSGGLEVTFIRQEKQLGTGHALAECRNYLRNEDQFVVAYGDVMLTGQATKSLLDFTRSSRLDGAILAVESGAPSSSGVVVFRDGLLENILEKPQDIVGPVNSGLYVLPAASLEATESLRLSPRGEYELTDILNLLARSGRRIGVVKDKGEWWFDVGRPADYLRANMFYLRKNLGNALVLPRFLRAGSSLLLKGPCLIGRDVSLSQDVAVIGPTVISSRVSLGAHTTVEASVLLEDVKVGSGVKLSHAVVGENAELGDHVQVKGRGPFPRLVVAPGAKIPSSTVLEAGTVFE